jgi:uncharacterized protein YlxW (UPF0749 family)
MNPFLSRLSGQNSWVVPVSIMSLILGVMLNFAWITSTTRDARLKRVSPGMFDRLGTGGIDMIGEYSKMQDAMSGLQKKVTQLENSMGSSDQESKMLNKNLQEAKMFAGLVPVQGPGIKIVLSDAKTGDMTTQDVIIHDADVLKVVNELHAAHAEAISVNGHRVIARSSFRCVGPVIHVDNIPVASPITIIAIGNMEALYGGLNLPGGVLDEIRQTSQDMVKVEKLKSVVIEAYGGPTKSDFAIPVTAKSTEGNDGEKTE